MLNVTIHKIEERAFLLQTARRAAERFGLPDLRPEAANTSESLDRDELDRLFCSIKKGEKDMLVKELMSKHIHSVFYKHI